MTEFDPICGKCWHVQSDHDVVVASGAPAKFVCPASEPGEARAIDRKTVQRLLRVVSSTEEDRS